MIRKALRLVLLIVAWLALALGCWGASIWFEWPWWGGVALFLGLLSLYFSVGFVRRLVANSRDRVLRVLAARREDKGALNPIQDLKQVWRAGLDTLRGSSLKRRGDPIHALPWYLMLGEAGSGKTSALKRARLASAVKEVNPAAPSAPTRNIEWWFFDQSVVIDTAGRYTSAPAGSSDHGEWLELLDLMSRARKREPLNGLVVTLPADSLRGADPDALAATGRALRTRIDEVMRLFDARFPVYVLVTKLDQLYGMDEWTRHLPEGALDQPMGHVVAGDEPVDAFVARAMGSVGERLKDLRLLATRDLEHIDPGLLLFPVEFESLTGGLAQVLGAAFGENAYLESPLLRGMFFCSSHQHGAMSSAVLPEESFSEQTLVLPGTTRGVFLREVLGRILPGDRHLVRPLGRLAEWGRITRNLGLAAWVLAAVVAGVLLTASFTHTFNTLTTLRDSYPGKLTLSGKFGADLVEMTKYHAVIKWMEERDHDWLARLAPFNDSVVTLETRMRETFSENFQRFLLGALDGQIAKRIKPLSEAGQAKEDITSRYIQFIVRRLNLVKARLDGKGRDFLAGMPPPSRSGHTVIQITSDLDPKGVTGEAAKAFGDLYVAYLAWQDNPATLKLERDTLAGWLNQIALYSDDLRWLGAWANEQTFLKPVRLTEFWGGAAIPDAVEVEAAYTAKARDTIYKFLEEVEQSAGKTEAFAAKRGAFDAWYRQARLAAWHSFIINFDQGKDTLVGEAAWRQALPHLTGPQSPYDRMLVRLVGELDDVSADKAPEWLMLARQLNAVKPVGRKPEFLDSASRLAGSLNAAGKRIIQGAIESGPAAGKAAFDGQLAAIKAFDAYYADLNKVWKEAVTGEGKAAKVAADFYGFQVDPNVKDSALSAAHQALAALRTALPGESYENQAVWDLVAGPLAFNVEYVNQQASCALQREWESKVVFPTKGTATPKELSDLLFGAKGVLWDFTDNSAKPFLRRDAHQYVPVETLGYRIPFNTLFLHYVNGVMEQKAGETRAQKEAEITRKELKIAEEERRTDQDKAKEDVQKRMADLDRRIGEQDKKVGDIRKAIDGAMNAQSLVTLNALPTHVNPDAAAFPQATVLQVECAPSPKTLANYNFPVMESFTFSRKVCGDTQLTIKFGDFNLVRKYSGADGFVRFLRDFHDGARTYGRDDFPAQKARLADLNISQVKVQYEMSGQDQILAQQQEIENLQRDEKEAQRNRDALEAKRKALEEEQAAEREIAVVDKKTDLVRQRADLAQEREQLAKAPVYDTAVPARIAACWEQPEPRPRRVEEAPAAVEAPKAKPVARKPVKAGDWMVQVGVFPREYANRTKVRMVKAGFDPIEEAISWSDGRTVYRLRIGPFGDKMAAGEAAGKVEDLLDLDTMLVRSTPTAPPAKAP